MDDMPPKSLIAPYLKPLLPIRTNAQQEGALRPPIRCLLCDIYGTLLISGIGDVGQTQIEAMTIERLSWLLERYCISQPAKQVIDNLHQAIQREHLQARGTGIEFPEVRIEKIWQQLLPSKSRKEILCFAIEFEMLLNPVWPMPHLSQLLSVCRQRGILLGVISNAQFFTLSLFELLTEASLDSLGFCQDLMFLSYHLGIAKPSGRLFQMAVDQLKKVGIDPRRTAYIGNDMRKDIRPAKKCSFQTILFAGDARSLRTNNGGLQISTIEADLIVTDLHQVIPYLISSD